MAKIGLGSNIASLRAQRSLNDSTASLTRISERLSTGLRISRASDDAAGLAVSESLKADVRLFTVALRNVSDGISVTTIAEGALTQLSTIVSRQIELATAAANGTFGRPQRLALQAEAAALTREYNRIVDTTTFNDVQLFASSNSTMTIQAGTTSSESINIALGDILESEAGDGTFSSAQTVGSITTPEHAASADFNQDGYLDIVSARTGAGGTITVFLNNRDGTFTAQSAMASGSNAPYDLKVADFNKDGIIDFVTSNGATNQAVFIGNGDGTFRSPTVITLGVGSGCDDVEIGDLDNDGNLDLVFADRLTSQIYTVFGNGNGTFSTATSLGTVSTPRDIALGDINNDGLLDIFSSNMSGSTSLFYYMNSGRRTFSSLQTMSGMPASTYAITLQDINFDGNVDLAYAASNAYIRLGNGDGTFASAAMYSLAGATTLEALYLEDLNGDGVRDLIATQQTTTDRISYRLGVGDGTFGSLNELSPGDNPIGLTFGDFNNDNLTDIVAAVRQGNSLAIFFQNPGALPQQGLVNLTSQSEARTALTTLRTDLSQITTALGRLGSHQSRLTIAENHLQTLSLNYQQASARITDADMAYESAQYLRTRVLQEVGTSILAQSSRLYDLALRLLSF